MRVIFSIVGLLVVVVIVGLLAKQQLQPLPAVTGAASGASTQSAAKALERKTSDDVKKALDAGMQRNGDAEGASESR
jgi:hypothetical protein